jgi:hypothetical protein
MTVLPRARGNLTYQPTDNSRMALWRLPNLSDSKMRSWVLWDSEPTITVLGRTSSNLTVNNRVSPSSRRRQGPISSHVKVWKEQKYSHASRWGPKLARVISVLLQWADLSSRFARLPETWDSRIWPWVPRDSERGRLCRRGPVVIYPDLHC